MLLLRLIFFFLIPTFLIYIGKDETFFNWIKSEFSNFAYIDIERTQLFAFVIGTFWVGVYNPLYFELSRKKFMTKNEKYIDLLNHNKITYIKLLKNEIGFPANNIQVRLFFPKKDIISLYKEKFKGKITLGMKHVEGITDDFVSNDLSFIASKELPEGMVGKSFILKNGFCDFDLSTQNKYFLTDKQKILVGNTKFCATMPIFKQNSQKVKAILSIDSDELLPIDPVIQEEKLGILNDHLRYLAAFTLKYLN